MTAQGRKSDREFVEYSSSAMANVSVEVVPVCASVCPPSRDFWHLYSVDFPLAALSFFLC
jgi:hypothetical protein